MSQLDSHSIQVNHPMTRTESYYGPDSAKRAGRIRALFDRIAPRYDLINDLQSFGLHRMWKRKLLDLASPQPSDVALDVCCGTGDITVALGRKAGQVYGVDFSEGMLELARQRTSDPTTRFIEGDALKLPFEDRSFDLVTIAYGLRNLVGFEDGIDELCRVLKPGGRLYVLDFGKPDQKMWRSFYFTYLEWVVPLFGKVFCGDSAAYRYILESLRHYPAQQGVCQAFQSRGLESVSLHSFLGGVMAINGAKKAKEPC